MRVSRKEAPAKTGNTSVGDLAAKKWKKKKYKSKIRQCYKEGK